MHVVNGGLSEWTTWTGCSKMCVQGHQTRRRLCNNPPSRCGGDPCGGMVASYHSHIHETEGQLAIVHRAMYQVGRRTEDPKLSPHAPCIPGSRPLFCFPPFNLAGFSLISPACYHFRTSTSHPRPVSFPPRILPIHPITTKVFWPFLKKF